MLATVQARDVILRKHFQRRNTFAFNGLRIWPIRAALQPADVGGRRLEGEHDVAADADMREG